MTTWHPPSSSQPPPNVPAGWYTDPEGRGQRYWDGHTWTQQIAPAPLPAPAAPKSPRAGDWIGAVLLALLIPVVGFIAGVVYVAKGDERRAPGWLCIGLSVLMFFVWVGITSGGGDAAPPVGSYQ